MDAVKDWIAREPLRFRALLGAGVAVAAAFGLSVDVNAIVGGLVLLGVVSETARAKVTPS